MNSQKTFDAWPAKLCRIGAIWAGIVHFFASSILPVVVTFGFLRQRSVQVRAAGKASCCLLCLMILPLQVGCRANCNNSGKITLGAEFRQLWQENITVRAGYQLDIAALQR